MREKLLLALVFCFIPCVVTANDSAPQKIGFIGSLTGFAASWGNAVHDGAELAVEELNADGAKIELIVEDDQSVATKTVTAYQRLHSLSGTKAIVGGSWWLNSIAKKAEGDRTILLSCETLVDENTTFAKTYFLLQGDLRRWMTAFEPLIDEKGWRSAAIVRFSSGFGETLGKELARIYRKPGRTWLGEIEYSDISLSDAASVALEVKKRSPEMVYIDAQPGGYATLRRKLIDLGVTKTTILSHGEAFDAFKESLLPSEILEGSYFSLRQSAAKSFQDKFLKRYGKPATLNADLGYYSVYLANAALSTDDPVSALKSKPLEVSGNRFEFDENNAYNGIAQDIWRFENGEPVLISK